MACLVVSLLPIGELFMNVRFLAKVFCCVCVGVCLAGIVSAKDCGTCGGGCKGVANKDGDCTPTNNGTCQVKNYKPCESGCACSSGSVKFAACGCV